MAKIDYADGILKLWAKLNLSQKELNLSNSELKELLDKDNITIIITLK